MNKHPFCLFSLAAAFALALAAAAHADTLATWSLNNTVSGTSGNSNALSVGAITAGSAVTSITVTNNGVRGEGWNSSARNDNAYFQFTVTATNDYYLNLGELAMNFRSTKTGPPKAEVRWSFNGTTWTSLATFDVPLDSNGHPFNSDFSGIKVDSGTTLTVRIYAWGASAKSGPFRIGNGSAMILSGTAVGTKQRPTISFPNAAESVPVSNTLSVAISVQPEGSGIASWSIDPKPTGAHSLSNAIFSFTPVAADKGGTNTLSVIATNVYGASTNTLPIAVTDYIPLGSWHTGFEKGKSTNPNYATTNVNIDDRAWSVQQIAFSGKTSSGTELPKVGDRACVFGSSKQAYMISVNKMLSASNGFGSVSFLYAEYPGTAEQPCPPLIVEVATDLSLGDWVEVGRVYPADVSELAEASFDIGSPEPVYLRLRTEYVYNSRRVCIDELTVKSYEAPVRSAFEKYLLKYNVTPGDPGCASEKHWAAGENENSYKTDDFDEDGYSNWAEYNAKPQTNPYDKNSHP